jgi:PKD repeat protein
MRSALAVVVCFVALLAGCGSGSSGGSSEAPTPQAPTANAGGPYTGTAGVQLSFSGTGSIDPQGQALTYAWSFGDGGTGTGLNQSHTYGAPGTYTVSLTVTDSSNLIATATSKATIAAAPSPPTANFGGPFVGNVNVPITFNASQSSDPQGQALTYAWTFGDGGSATGAGPTHTFTNSGSFIVILIVTDTGGLSGTTTAAGVIAPAVPTASAAGPYTGTVGAAVTFTGVGSIDPQGQALTYVWTFGDGGTGTGVSPTHIYAAPGTFTVSVKVTDTSSLSNTATTKATIAAAPPVAKAGGPYTGTTGTPVNFNGGGSTDPQGQTLSYTWKFGDGTTGTGVSQTHAYAVAGTYTVSLTATDTSGLTDTATIAATIAAAPLAGAALTGLVYGGQQPVAGAHVYLFAANTTGYGQASVSLLNAANTSYSDALGAYVITGSNGGFSLTGEYSCTNGQQVYLYVLGGNSGSGVNSASGLMAAIGNCPSSMTTVTVNEVTTVAAAYALAGFATDATHISSSGTALAQVGVANAFANAGNLASLATGVALRLRRRGMGPRRRSQQIWLRVFWPLV